MRINATMLAHFAFCPYFFYLLHIKGIRQKPSKNLEKGREAHKNTQEVPVKLRIGKVEIKGRADLVERSKVVELKYSSPFYWRMHATQASFYALALEKPGFEVRYVNLGLSLFGKPFNLEPLVNELVFSLETGIFRKNKASCFLCPFKNLCRVYGK